MWDTDVDPLRRAGQWWGSVSPNMASTYTFQWDSAFKKQVIILKPYLAHFIVQIFQRRHSRSAMTSGIHKYMYLSGNPDKRKVTD